MNKKVLAAISLVAAMAITTLVAYKALAGLDKLDLSDPFEVDIDDE